MRFSRYFGFLTNTRNLFAVVFLLASIAWAAYSFDASARVSVLYQQIQYDISPTFDRAYALGEVHFSSLNPALYDIVAAERYYKDALAIAPGKPLVRHELARIAFLRSDFDAALSLIDKEIAMPGGPVSPSSYYVRGLIEGYMDRFDDSALDYEKYLEHDPGNWAATNDLAWVLLKAERYDQAIVAIDKVLPYWQENPWLLNSRATALYELGRLPEAKIYADRAGEAVAKVTESEWSHAYPGNDPLVAREGLAAFKKAVSANIHTISVALEQSDKSVR